MPAIRALVKIGPESSSALIDTWWHSLSAHCRYLALSTIGIIGAPGTDWFLQQAASFTEWSRSLAIDGLKYLSDHGTR